MKNLVNYHLAETAGRLKIVSLFSVSFPLVGNPSTCSGSQERFWRSPTSEDRLSQNDKNMELRQRPQGVIFIKIISILLFLCFNYIYISTVSSASEAEEYVLRIQRAYENIKDLKGSFIQKRIIKDLNRTDIYKGEFFIKYPLKMKWMYKGKASQEITINNNAVLIYKKGDDQAYKGRFDRATYGQTPIALLTGFGDIKEEFNVSEKEDLLILKPKKSIGNITSIKIVISEGDFPIRSFTIQDGRSNVIEIELKDIKINTGLKDSLFEFSLPKGVNIYEQDGY